jgi:hypothetical protein
VTDSFFELRSARDIYAKARRDFDRMEAEPSVDTVFNFFVTVYHVKDYVEAAAGSSILREMYDDRDFQLCQFLCNKGKHLKLEGDRRPWDTHADISHVDAPFAVLAGDRRINVLDLGRSVIDKWGRFLEKHGLR